MGSVERIIRIIIAVVVGVLFWQGIIVGTLAYFLLAVAGVFLLSSFVSFILFIFYRKAKHLQGKEIIASNLKIF